MNHKKKFLTSPAWFIPVILISLLAFIEILHVSMHRKYCKTEAQWMNQKGLDYDRESSVE